mmetsp:Transcript_27077/g.48258  ORF Transcript_27077/g.48258 Transcript_27077/m.48258 type:complete len:205 (-) Transcript_27077:576-1190(-)
MRSGRRTGASRGVRVGKRRRQGRTRACSMARRAQTTRADPGWSRQRTRRRRTTWCSCPNAGSTPGVVTLRASMQSSSSPSRVTSCFRPAWTARSRFGTSTGRGNACAPTWATQRACAGSTSATMAAAFCPPPTTRKSSCGIPRREKSWEPSRRARCLTWRNSTATTTSRTLLWRAARTKRSIRSIWTVATWCRSTTSTWAPSTP